MEDAGHHRRDGRHGVVILALLSLWMQVLAPPGFMLAPAGSGAAIVICTGHGPLSLDPGRHSSKAPGSKTDAPCPFVGHGFADTPTPLARIATPTEAIAPVGRPLGQLFTPSLGLSAPPPPARGPPSLT